MRLIFFPLVHDVNLTETSKTELWQEVSGGRVKYGGIYVHLRTWWNSGKFECDLTVFLLFLDKGR